MSFENDILCALDQFQILIKLGEQTDGPVIERAQLELSLIASAATVKASSENRNSKLLDLLDVEDDKLGNKRVHRLPPSSPSYRDIGVETPITRQMRDTMLATIEKRLIARHEDTYNERPVVASLIEQQLFDRYVMLPPSRANGDSAPFLRTSTTRSVHEPSCWACKPCRWTLRPPRSLC